MRVDIIPRGVNKGHEASTPHPCRQQRPRCCCGGSSSLRVVAPLKRTALAAGCLMRRNNKRRGLDLRGLPLTQEDAGEGELERGRHHLLGQRLELELDVRLRGHGAGVLLHVDAAGGQGLPSARGRLLHSGNECGRRCHMRQGESTENTNFKKISSVFSRKMEEAEEGTGTGRRRIRGKGSER